MYHNSNQNAYLGISGVSGGGGSAGNIIIDKIKQSLKTFANWLLEISKKALDNLPAIIGSIISFLLRVTAGIIGFLAEHNYYTIYYCTGICFIRRINNWL